MKRSYAILAACTLAGALLLLATARPHTTALRQPPETAPAAAAAQQVTLVVSNGTILPARLEVGKGAALEVRMENHDDVAHTASLLGYESAVSPAALAPGGAATLRFSADRPGSDFAWIVDGTPAGQFVVHGSHLVEGHR